MSSNEERTYHATSTPYSLPNDASEHQRLDLQSEALNRMMHNQPCHAPITNHPSWILEIGPGTGSMLKHFATTYPRTTQIVGLDISPVPNQETFPSNVIFLQGDFREVVPPSESFDYVFSRMLVYGMTDWPDYIRRAKKLLKSGGWLELQELSVELLDGEGKVYAGDWLREQTEAWKERGLDMRCARKLEGYLVEAGFVDVQVKEFRWMFGPREGHPETDMLAAFTNKYTAEANFGAYKKVVGPRKTTEELVQVEAEMKEAWSYNESGNHMPFFVVYGRKP